MAKPDKKTWLIAGAVLLVAAGCFMMYQQFYIKAAYVDQVQLFNAFRLKKVLEAEYQKVENLRKQQSDSMALGISLMQQQAHGPQQLGYVQQQKEYLAYKQNEFAEMNEQLKMQYNEQIRTQLNQYIKDYALKNKVDFVLGSTGEGDVLFAAERFDVTKELIHYVNTRFEGENK